MKSYYILKMKEYILSFMAFMITTKVIQLTKTLKNNQQFSLVVNVVEAALTKAISRGRRSLGGSEANQLLSTFHLWKGELCHLQQVRLDLSRVPQRPSPNLYL